MVDIMGKLNKCGKKEATWLCRVTQWLKVPAANPDCMSLINIYIHIYEFRRQGIKIPSQQIQCAGKIPNHQNFFGFS